MFFLFIVCFGLHLYAIGQGTFGLKAGVNLSNQTKTFTTTQNSSAQKQETKPLLGYQVGSFFKAKMSSKLTFSAEVNFSLIGSKTKYVTETQLLNPDGRTHYYNDKLGYIEVPVTVQYNFTRLYVGAGPGIGFKVYSRITNFENRSYQSDLYKALDATANILLGYKVSKKCDVNFRSSHGLLNIHQQHEYAKTKNRFLNLSLLYSLK